MAKKHGPCFHCGIHSTPHWRNGPELKPVLCNACGTRYRKRGIIGLEDYLPKHFQPKFLDNLQNFNSGQNLLLSGYVTDSGGEKPPLWNPTIPSRKRSQVVYVKITPMKRFRIQSPAEVLLFNNTNNFLPNNEIGLGCVLLKSDDTSTTYI